MEKNLSYHHAIFVYHSFVKASLACFPLYFPNYESTVCVVFLTQNIMIYRVYYGFGQVGLGLFVVGHDPVF